MKTKMFAIWTALAVSSTAMAQGPGLLAQPDLHLGVAGTVLATARAPDGSVFVGGSFSSIAGVPRNNIAKLSPDGSLDADWNPGTDDVVRALGVDAKGGVFAAGSFQHAGGAVRDFLAKFSASGTGVVDADWNPAPFGYVSALAIDADGSVFVVGGFQAFTPGTITIGGQSRNWVAKLAGNGSGAADPAWNPNPGGEPDFVAVGDSLFLGRRSAFPGMGGRALLKLSRSGAGAVDTAWDAAALSAGLSAMALDGQGFLYVASMVPTNILKVSASGTGAADPGWTSPAYSTQCKALAVDVGGSLYAAVYGGANQGISRFASNGAPDSSWFVTVDVTQEGVGIATLSVGSDATLTVGGDITAAGGVPRDGIARISSDASLLPAVDADKSGRMFALVQQSDGGMIVGGSFNAGGAAVHHNLLRVRPDRTVDPDWQADVDGTVYALAVDQDSNIYVGGEFGLAGGVPRSHLARFSAAGAVDSDWIADANAQVRTLAFDEQSAAVFAGGYFATINGNSHVWAAKIGVDGVVDSAWAPQFPFSAYVNRLLLDGAGHVYVGGYFSSVSGQPHANIARLSTSGAGDADASWAPVTSDVVNDIGIDNAGYVYSASSSGVARFAQSGSGAADSGWHPPIGVHPDTHALAIDSDHDVIYVGGVFAVPGTPVPTQFHLAKLSLSGAGDLDTSWTPNPAPGWVFSLGLVGGRLYVGGSFDRIADQPRAGFAVFDPDVIFDNSFD